MIQRSVSVDSIAIFGSLVRGDNDNLSDRDILLVADDRLGVALEAQVLRRYGWSCACYSWGRLSESVRRQLLFIQHLKQESQIVCDKNRRLNDLLSRFSPKSAYNDEACEAKKLICAVETIPATQCGYLWALDVLMVGFRSLAVATLANEGIYCFSFNDILSTLHKIGILHSGDLSDLHRLRNYKWQFRKRRQTDKITWSVVIRLIDIVDKRFRIGINVRRASSYDLMEVLTQRQDDRRNWYINSRKLEAVLLHLSPKSRSVQRDVLNEKRKLFDLIEAPSQYAWLLQRQWPNVTARLHELASQCIVMNENR
jgi:hypothetical protein